MCGEQEGNDAQERLAARFQPGLLHPGLHTFSCTMVNYKGSICSGVVLDYTRRFLRGAKYSEHLTVSSDSIQQHTLL